jgi:hypothetical protein
VTITSCSSWCSYPWRMRFFRGSAIFPCGISRAYSMYFSYTPVWWSFFTTGCTERSTQSPCSGTTIISTISPLFLSQQLVINSYCHNSHRVEEFIYISKGFYLFVYLFFRWGENDVGGDRAVFVAAGAPSGRCSARESLHEHVVHVPHRRRLLQVLGPLQL